MTSSSSHVLPPFDLNEDQYFPFLASSSTSSLICASPSDFNPSQELQESYHREILKQYQEAQEVVDHEYGSQGGSSDQQNYLSPPSLSTLESRSEYGIKFEGDHQPKDDCPSDKVAPVSWMSSKMRLMKKMVTSDRSPAGDKSIRAKLRFRDQKQSSQAFDTRSGGDYLASNSTIIRTCSDCHTTRTPLWRGGPQGPKSLCNACGIRQRKARRALAAETAAANNGVHVNNISSVQTKVHCFKKKSGKGHVGRQKKQCNPSATPCRQTNNLVFEDFIVNLSNSLVLHRMIPQDETEAAILLMALSCGLVSG